MKKRIELREGWAVKEAWPAGFPGPEEAKFGAAGAAGVVAGMACASHAAESADVADAVDAADGWIPAAAMPAQVHDILLQHGRIADPLELGKAAECLWVAERDWFYRTKFPCADPESRSFLHFLGLDTLVDIILNGARIASHQDMYLPLRVEVTGKLLAENTLLLHFHSPHAYLAAHPLPSEWRGKIKPNRLLRKPEHDFTDYLGAKPYFTCIGIYDRVYLEVLDEVEITEFEVSGRLSGDFRTGRIPVAVAGSGTTSGGQLQVEVRDPDGKVTASHLEPLPWTESGDWRLACELAIPDPALWWPRGHGEQPLYEVTVSLLGNGGVKDTAAKSIGFREVRMPKPFHFLINGRHITLWGAQPAQIQGFTHCWDNAKSNRILDLAEHCNMNAQRIWGASDRYDDAYYEETDRRGILVWQEFFHDYGMYPDDPDYRALCRREAEYQVQRLKHHPSLLFWCGGNESIMGAEYDHPGEPVIGAEIFQIDYAEVCQRLDPDRYYHVNSPYGGAYANDPLAGDTHSYTNTWYVPGADYPVMIAEEIRASPPAAKSMRRYLGDLAWPAGYSGLMTKRDRYPWPESWNLMASAQAWRKIPPAEQFYDADSLESAVYRFGAAHGLYLRRILEANRRGKPSEQPDRERLCEGHFVCRWNDSWPIIYGSMLDAYLEPYLPYYAVKRAYEPILLSFDIQNFIYLWLVNDSPAAIAGEVTVELFDMHANRTVKEIRFNAQAPAGESVLIGDLNALQQFPRSHMLVARLFGPQGEVVARTCDYADIEKHMQFPEAKLTMAIDGSTLTLTTDRFARCVELSGDADGDAFGWVFEDNYFDLLPGETKQVKVSGLHDRGTIRAQSYYSPDSSEIQLKAGTNP